jgi:hypothetical protein
MTSLSAVDVTTTNGRHYMHVNGTPILLSPEQVAQMRGGAREEEVPDERAIELEGILRDPRKLMQELMRPVEIIPGQRPKPLVKKPEKAGEAAAAISKSINKLRGAKSDYQLTLSEAAEDGGMMNPSMRAALTDIINWFFPETGWFGVKSAPYHHDTVISKLEDYSLVKKKTSGSSKVLGALGKFGDVHEARFKKLERKIGGLEGDINTINVQTNALGTKIDEGFEAFGKSQSDIVAVLAGLKAALPAAGASAAPPTPVTWGAAPAGALPTTAAGPVCKVTGCSNPVTRKGKGKHWWATCADHKDKAFMPCSSGGKHFIQDDGSYAAECKRCASGAPAAAAASGGPGGSWFECCTSAHCGGRGDLQGQQRLVVVGCQQRASPSSGDRRQICICQKQDGGGQTPSQSTCNGSWVYRPRQGLVYRALYVGPARKLANIYNKLCLLSSYPLSIVNTISHHIILSVPKI